MDNFISVFLYIVVMIVIALAGGLSRRKRKQAPVQAPPKAQPRKDPGAQILESLLKGAGLSEMEEAEQPLKEGKQEQVFAVDETEDIEYEPSVSTSADPSSSGGDQVKPEDGIADLIPGEEGNAVFQETEEALISDDLPASGDHEFSEKQFAKTYKISDDSERTGILSEILKDFDLKKAVIYSEIIHTKYF